jgi:O-antigen ligase/Flp pilus assembly protein TadD
MRKRLFMAAAFLLLAALVLGTRYGDVTVFTADWLFAAATLLVFACWCFWWLPDHRLVPLSTDWTSLLLVAAIAVLVPLSSYPYGAQVEAAKLVSALLLSLMVLNLVQERADLQFFMNGLLFLGVLVAAVSFAYYMSAMSPLFYFTRLWSRNLAYHFVVNGQLWGLWQYHNTFGAFLGLCSLLALGMASGDSRRDWRLLYSVCAGFLFMVLYLTTSRGTFLMTSVGLVALVLLAPRGARGKLVLRTVVILAAAAGLTLLNKVTWATTAINVGKGEALGSFVSGGDDQSNQTRLHMMALAARVFGQHPLAGTGLGSFGHVWTATEWVPDVARRIDPHSLFFRFLAETGLLGTVPLFAWIARRGLRGLDRVFGSRADMAVAGLWAGTLAFFLHMCMDVDYVYAVAPVLLFFCLALLATRVITYDLPSRDERGMLLRRRRIPCLVAGGLALVLALVPIQRGAASLVALNMGDLDPALKARRLATATVLDPRNDTYWSMLGSTYAGMLSGGVTGPATDAARSAYLTARDLAPDDYRPWWSLGMLELNLRSPQAVTYLQQAEKLYPTLATIKGWLALADVYVDGDTAAAQAKAAEALAITPGEPYAVTAQAFCALSEGDPVKARNLLTPIVKASFSNKFAYFGLALCYRAEGNTAMERTELEYSRRINPNLVQAMQRLRELSSQQAH